MPFIMTPELPKVLQRRRSPAHAGAVSRDPLSVSAWHGFSPSQLAEHLRLSTQCDDMRNDDCCAVRLDSMSVSHISACV
ncbi:hypothetical protein PGIGA_G00172800 [Pangasianodon gigas]|uniref:Uncharacterized protein n=1 Tax=Pangasianodon gigas TaxID=30993 RepID=A0ACC5XUD6_PANGG|nr:hypothetical protein [Pangasianodon gigas]